ncbi:hypothetical protein AB4K20DRAFT_1989468 [Rhizopus microsporus]|uniref:Uncharacterized protein n=1 Tax=Rhizopus microsporus TaxID=58291 RepID=A0A1X0S5R2_RHIZD|nr:hypothetical protein BCV71DRAFT_233893 [Rhizopus microsporus]
MSNFENIWNSKFWYARMFSRALIVLLRAHLTPKLTDVDQEVSLDIQANVDPRCGSRANNIIGMSASSRRWVLLGDDEYHSRSALSDITTTESLASVLITAFLIPCLHLQEAAFVSLIRVDNFNADVVIVTSVKASADEYTHYSEQDINWSLLDDIMTSEDLKDVSL